jgi:hypothetical protein
MSSANLPTAGTLDALARVLQAHGLSGTLVIAHLIARLEGLTPVEYDQAARVLGLDAFEPLHWHRYPQRFVERQLITALEECCCLVGRYVN